MITELYHIDLINLYLGITLFKTRWNFQYIFKQFFLWKKERFHSAGYRAQDLSIAGRLLYHLSYGGSTKLFSQNPFSWALKFESYVNCLFSSEYSRINHIHTKRVKNIIILSQLMNYKNSDFRVFFSNFMLRKFPYMYWK